MTKVSSSAATLTLVALLTSACSLQFDSTDVAGVSRNECSGSDECGGGECWSGVCVAYSGKLPTVLLAVTAPVGTPRVGATRLLSVAEGLDRSSEGYRLDLEGVENVRGFLRTYASEGSPCTAGTFPAEVTLTPRQTAYGFPSTSYVARTALVTTKDDDVCQRTAPRGVPFHEFTVDVPRGDYDVYVAPLPSSASEPAPDGGSASACELVPQVLALSVTDGECGEPLRLKTPKTLEFLLQWEGVEERSLTGWSIDVVHPVTGQAISRRTLLEGDPVRSGDESQSGYAVSLGYSPTEGESPEYAGQELVRLSPPEGVVAPRLRFVRAGLEASSPPRSPALGRFPTPVRLEGWVERAFEFAAGQEAPAPGSATFTATRVDGVAAGVFASYQATAPIGADGAVTADLLPGTYRVRITPHEGLGLAATETELTIPCERDPLAPEACVVRAPSEAPRIHGGWLALVPPAAKVTGTVSSPLGERMDGVTVRALPAALDAKRCAEGTLPELCPRGPADILDRALGESAFAPRMAVGLSERGRFRLGEVDCGECTAENGAVFDFSVRPQEGTRFPWLVRSEVTVNGDLALPDLRVSLPIIHRGVVSVPQANAQPVLVGGALVAAYVMRDAAGQPVTDPGDLPSCSSSPSLASGESAGRCIRSVVQIAETRADPDGSFELILPSELE